MKTIVCYGDSNTWGFNPATQERFSITERWTGIFAQELGAEYHIIEEGLNGRTTIWDDPILEGRNGRTYFLPCLWSHQPIDLVTIMLGTNDLKGRFAVTAYDIATGVGALADLAVRSGAGLNGGSPHVLILVPPLIGILTEFAEAMPDADSKARKFAEHYERIARKYRCHLIDASKIVKASDIDGVHLEADQHRKLGLAVAQRVREILK